MQSSITFREASLERYSLKERVRVGDGLYYRRTTGLLVKINHWDAWVWMCVDVHVYDARCPLRHVTADPRTRPDTVQNGTKHEWEPMQLVYVGMYVLRYMQVGMYECMCVWVCVWKYTYVYVCLEQM